MYIVYAMAGPILHGNVYEDRGEMVSIYVYVCDNSFNYIHVYLDLYTNICMYIVYSMAGNMYEDGGKMVSMYVYIHI
jgi:hypothetical protein